MIDQTGNIDDLLAAARQEAALDDFGSMDFVEPMKMFLSYNRYFTQAGIAERYSSVRGHLVNRLRVVEGLRRNPEILDEDVSDPIMIVGFPRSGTTALQRMMSADPTVQALYTWRTFNPAPFPDEEPGNPVARIAVAKAMEDQDRDSNPDFFAAHAMLAEDAEEDLWLHSMTYEQIGNYVWQPFPDYAEYLQSRPRQGPYDYVSKLYKYLQWQDGGRRGRRWIMKSPNHMGCLDEVLRVHPKAVLIYPVRDYREVIASLCALLEVVHSTRQKTVDPKLLGAVNLKVWGHELRRFNEARQRLGDRLPVLTMPYIDILRDPIPYIREAHRMAGGVLTPAGEAAVQAWRAANPQGKHGSFQYDPTRYGLTDKMIDDALGKAEL